MTLFDMHWSNAFALVVLLPVGFAYAHACWCELMLLICFDVAGVI